MQVAPVLQSPVPYSRKRMVTIKPIVEQEEETGLFCMLKPHRLAAMWLLKQIEPMFCNTKHGLNIWEQQMDREWISPAVFRTFQTVLHQRRQQHPCDAFRFWKHTPKPCSSHCLGMILPGFPHGVRVLAKWLSAFASLRRDQASAHALARREKRSANSGSRRME